MTWMLAVGLSLTIWALTQITLKSIVDRLPKAKALVLQFFICAGLIWTFALITKAIQFEQSFLLIAVVGFVNAFGAYCQWRAYAFSLSKTALFLPLSGVITVGLAALFLGESATYNFWTIIGVIFLFSAAFFLSKKEKGEGESIEIKWLLFVMGMILIVAGVSFMMKLFSFTIPRTTFLSYWYGGAFLGSLPILWLERKDKRKIFQKGSWRVPLASAGILGVLATTYWAFQLAPAGMVLSIQAFGMASLPIPIGWFLFKEGRRLTRTRVVGFVLGALGVIFIVLNQLI